MHYVGTAFVNITTSVDIVNNIICGNTTSLSPFIIVQPELAVGGIAEAPDATVAPSSSSAPPYADFAGIAAATGVVGIAAGGVVRQEATDALAALCGRCRWRRLRMALAAEGTALRVETPA